MIKFLVEHHEDIGNAIVGMVWIGALGGACWWFMELLGALSRM